MPPESIYIVFEYTGTDLKKWFKKIAGRISHGEFVCIASQILDSVRHLNLNGIAHRDLKLDNFTIQKTSNNDYKVTLIDFGLATTKLVDTVTPKSNRAFRGNAANSPLEVEDAIREGQKRETVIRFGEMDVFSSGCILYKLATLSYPYSKSKKNSKFLSVILDDKERLILHPIYNFDPRINDLIFGMLDDYESRISVNDALVQLEWIRL